MRGASGPYRAAVEELVKLRGAEGRDLHDRINALRGTGMADDLIDDLHDARLLGNSSLHDGIEFAPEEVADVASLIADAIYELYVDPTNRERVRVARASRRRRE